MTPKLPASGLPTSTSFGPSKPWAEISRELERELDDFFLFLQLYKVRLSRTDGSPSDPWAWVDFTCQRHREDLLSAGSCEESCPMNSRFTEEDIKYFRLYCEMRNFYL